MRPSRPAPRVRRSALAAGSKQAREELRIRLRLYLGEEIALGPGKADLLASILETGSIAQAAQRLGMSYMRAWTLIRTMNECFRMPLVEAVRGGSSGGRARLTPAGSEVLALYRQMTAEGLRAASPTWKKLQRHMRR